MAHSRRPTISLETLPPELQLHIFRFLQTSPLLSPSAHRDAIESGNLTLMDSPVELLSLCLVSKRVYSSASIALHEQVSEPRNPQRFKDPTAAFWLSCLLPKLQCPADAQRFKHTTAISLHVNLNHPAEAAALDALVHLPRVHTLYLTLANLSSSHLDALRRNLPSLHNIRTFTLFGAVGEGNGVQLMSSLLSLLASMPTLQHLCLRTSNWSILEQIPTSVLPSQAVNLYDDFSSNHNKKSLAIPNISLASGAAWITPYVQSSSVRHLGYHSSLFRGFDGLLEAASAFYRFLDTSPLVNLESLLIDLSTADYASFSNLGRLPRLMRLCLEHGTKSAIQKQLFSQLPRSLRRIEWWTPSVEAFRLLADLLASSSKTGLKLESVSVEPITPNRWACSDPEGRTAFFHSLVHLEVAASHFGVKLDPEDLHQRHLKMEKRAMRLYRCSP